MSAVEWGGGGGGGGGGLFRNHSWEGGLVLEPRIVQSKVSE